MVVRCGGACPEGRDLSKARPVVSRYAVGQIALRAKEQHSQADAGSGRTCVPQINQNKSEDGESTMGREFAEVQAEDFSKITIERMPHQEIEMALIGIGGGGVRGTQFKTEVVRAAGWNGERLATYAGKPEKAAAAFNKIRVILAETDEQDQVLQKVSAE